MKERVFSDGLKILGETTVAKSDGSTGTVADTAFPQPPLPVRTPLPELATSWA